MQHRVKTTSVKTWLVWSHAWSYNITSFSFKLRSNEPQKRATYFATLLQNAFKSYVARICCAYYHPRSNLSCNESGCCKLREYWLLIWQNYAGLALYTGVTSLSANQVCLKPVKRATCTEFVAKSRTTRYFLQPLFASCSNPICFKTGLVWVVKRATSLFNWLCSNVAKQVARFRGPFYRTFRCNTISHRFLKLLIILLSSKEICQAKSLF